MSNTLNELLGVAKQREGNSTSSNNSNNNSNNNKSQAQLNKCLNEKRRRDQENRYIEELAELVSATMTDTNKFSVKPDKNTILQETVNQINRITQEESGGVGDSAVQQSQVSSSKPTTLPNDALGPLLLEALDGFMFVVNGQGKVTFVSENVTTYLKYTQEDLVGKSIYNIIHVGDHAQFSSSLLPMSFALAGSNLQWPGDSTGSKTQRTFNCRMLIKPEGDEDDDVEVKQTQISQYESMQISAILQKNPVDADIDSSMSQEPEGAACLICIARRAGFGDKGSAMLGVEQFTTKQDRLGKILACDTGGLNPSHYPHAEFVGQNIENFCHANDLQLMSRHYEDALTHTKASSNVYRFKLNENRYVFVQTQSKLFQGNGKEQDYILSTHSIVRECDTDTELKGSASTSLMKSIIGVTGSKRSVEGDPVKSGGLMRSALLGTTGRQMNNAALQLAGGSMTSSLGNSMGLSGLNNFTSVGSDLETDVPTGGDTPNIDDVLSYLQSSASWETTQQGSTSANITGGHNPSMAAPHNSMTHVSWSNMPSVNMNTQNVLQQRQQQQMQQQHRPLPLNIPPNRVMPPGMKSPISPGFPTAGQRSPGFATGNPQRRSPASYPGQMSPSPVNVSQRSPAAFINHVSPSSGGMTAPQRSPVTSLLLPGGHSGFNPGSRTPTPVGYQPGSRTPTPNLMSPPVIGANNAWAAPSPGGGTTVIPPPPPSPLQALQSQIDMVQHPSTVTEHIKNFQEQHRSKQRPMFPSRDRKVEQRAKLRELLLDKESPITQVEQQQGNVSAKDRRLSESSAPESSSHTESVPPRPPSGQPARPASAQSQYQQPQQQPESTSADEHPDSSSKDVTTPTKKNSQNAILKQLLSQDDEAVEGEEEKPSTSEAQTSSSGKDETADNSVSSNEAEPKTKDDNLLLKELLNEDKREDGDDERDKQCQVLGKLLAGDDEPRNPESTSQLSLESLVSSRQNMPPMRPGNSTGEGSLQQLLSSNDGLDALDQPGPPTVSLNPSLLNRLMQQGSGSRNIDKDLGKILSDMWERQTVKEEGSSGFVPKGVKRRLSDMAADSTNCPDTEPSTSTGHVSTTTGGASLSKADALLKSSTTLSQRNALLTQLLSEKPTRELSVNTQHTVTPVTAVPQARLPKDLHMKLNMHENNNNNPGTQNKQKESPTATVGTPTTPRISGIMKENKRPTVWDNPKTSPNSPYPGNTKDSVGGTGVPQSGSQGMVTSASSGGPNNTPMLLSSSTTISTISSSGGGGSVTSSTDLIAGDPDLSQILQQATELQNDLSSGQLYEQSSSVPDDISNILEVVLSQSDIPLQEIDNLLGINNAAGQQQQQQQTGTRELNEQMAIDAIQEQLMREVNTGVNTPPSTMTTRPAMSSPLNITPNTQGNMMVQNQLQSPHISNENQLRQQLMQQAQAQQRQQQQQQQQQQFTQGGMLGLLTQEGPSPPRFNNPQPPQGFGGMASNFPAQTSAGMNPQVRMCLIQRHQAKQLKEQEKQERLQRRIMLQQQRQQFSPRFSGGQSFNQMGDSLSGQGIPENFSELMNTSMAPNVTLQQVRNRNASAPGPMSPRFPAPGGLTSPPAGSMGGPPQGMMHSPQQRQMSPFSSAQPSAVASAAAQWANQQRANPSMMAGGSMSQQGQGFGNNGPQFNPRFSDANPGQFNQASPQMTGLLSPQPGSQQQQMFQRNQMMQRQISMPVTLPSQGGQDSLIMSPHGQRLSPNQGAMGQSNTMGIGRGGTTGGNFPMTSMPQNMNPPAYMGGSPSSKSQFVKQELRDVVSRRMPQTSLAGGIVQPIADQMAPSFDTDGELPMDIIESIAELQQEQAQQHQLTSSPQMAPQTPGGSLNINPNLEETVRKEAKQRYQKFQSLTMPIHQQVKEPEDAESRAGNVFRNQLARPTSNVSCGSLKPIDPHSVNVIQTEPRPSVEDIRPNDNKNSLLQQLLSQD